MTAIIALDLDDVDRYADALSASAGAIVSGDLETARNCIKPIAFERWEGKRPAITAYRCGTGA